MTYSNPWWGIRAGGRLVLSGPQPSSGYPNAGRPVKPVKPGSKKQGLVPFAGAGHRLTDDPVESTNQKSATSKAATRKKDRSSKEKAKDKEKKRSKRRRSVSDEEGEEEEEEVTPRRSKSRSSSTKSRSTAPSPRISRSTTSPSSFKIKADEELSEPSSFGRRRQSSSLSTSRHSTPVVGKEEDTKPILDGAAPDPSSTSAQDDLKPDIRSPSPPPRKSTRKRSAKAPSPMEEKPAARRCRVEAKEEQEEGISGDGSIASSAEGAEGKVDDTRRRQAPSPELDTKPDLPLSTLPSSSSTSTSLRHPQAPSPEVEQKPLIESTSLPPPKKQKKTFSLIIPAKPRRRISP
ncbi:hypothetical protein BCR35DRAFT_76441 [Leucosporidium creatinivorum]|uniref:Uncharacterized protein n=1 Tax=Leucosporidium creatinivorum TaxID=106004 RepID=A0A1Y2G4R7_9BASI|nr:hypothetical protein BCR35DRAFT_76441 [Leucosporidium creatinivorum]